MKSLVAKTAVCVAGLFGLILSALPTHAASNPLQPVTVQFMGEGVPQNLPGQNATLAFLITELPISSNPAHPGRGTRISGFTAAAIVDPQDPFIPTPLTDLRMEIGRVYSAAYTATNMDNGSIVFHVRPPVGYLIEMEGSIRDMYPPTQAQNGIIKFRVIPNRDPAPSRAGSASSLSDNQLFWRVALGATDDGRSAGSLLLADTGYSTDWSDLFTPAGLVYDGTALSTYRSPTGVSSPYIPGAIRQINAPEACADIVPITTTKYEIKFYAQSQVTDNGSSANPRYTFTGLPYVTYTVEPSTVPLTSLKITKEVEGGKTWFTTVERTGDWVASTGPNYEWKRVDWTTDLNSAAIVSRRKQDDSQITYTNLDDYEYQESYVVENPNVTNGEALEGIRKIKMFPWGESVIEETVGTNSGAPRTTTYSYYEGSPQSVGYSQLKEVVRPGGDWEAYEYFGPGENGMTYGGYRVSRPFRSVPLDPPSVSTSGPTGRVTTYTFAAPYEGPQRMSLVETEINGVQVSKTEFEHYEASNFKIGSTLASRTTRYDHSDNNFSTRQKTVTRSYKYEPTLEGRLFSVELPDGTKTVHVLQSGGWNPSTQTFTVGSVGSGEVPASRTTVLNGTTDSTGATQVTTFDGSPVVTTGDTETDVFYIVFAESTASVTIRDASARIIRTEMRVWAGTWDLVSYEDFDYNDAGFLVSRKKSNSAEYTAVYEGDLKKSETDELGVETRYYTGTTLDYDDAGRLNKSTRMGSGGVPEVVTSFDYDAMGAITTQTIDPDDNESIVTSFVYDTARRLTQTTTPESGTTQITYNVSGRIKTITPASGGPRLEKRHLDGAVESITGTGVVAQFFEYAVETDGRMKTTVRTGGEASPRIHESWADWLGREVKTSRPGFSVGSVPAFETESIYDPVTGQLERSTRTGYADTLYEYDSLGQLSRTGLNVDTETPAQLVAASDDRITEYDLYYERALPYWWRTKVTKTYFDGESTPRTVSTVKTMLAGFATNEQSHTVSIDAENNVTVDTFIVNRTAKTATASTTQTGLGTATKTTTNGVVTSVTGFDGLTYATEYDSKLRAFKSIDPRTGNTITAYKNGTSLVESVTDPAGKTVSFTYDAMGRVTSTTDQEGKTSYTSYDDIGRVKRQWGDGIHPVEFGYQPVYGDRTSLTTYRNGSGWDGATWPTSHGGTADTTTWVYDSPSGLLHYKTTPTSVFDVVFGYNDRGQVEKRYWDRRLDAVPSIAVTTTYEYDSATGELTKEDYNDGGETYPTTDVTYTYTRTGQLKTVTDATGTRTFAYDSSKPWRLDYEDFGAFYGANNRLKSTYQSSGVVGRANGFQLGTSSNADAVLSQQWQYQSNGRFSAVVSASNEGAARTFTYGYETNSRLLDTLSVSNSSFAVTRTYDGQRDLLTSIETAGSASNSARFDYGYTDCGQRDWARQRGNAFEIGGTPVYRDYTYNSEGELTGAQAYLDASTNPPVTSPVAGDPLENLQHAYTYDNRGNRLSANQTGNGAFNEAFVANAGNQIVSRENKAIIVSGTAESATTAGQAVAAAVKIGSGPIEDLENEGIYWSHASSPSNTSAPVSVAVTAYAGESGTVRSETRTAHVPERTQTFSYDSDGNLITDGIRDYRWDAENRLVHAKTTSAAVTAGYESTEVWYTYDYLGRRVLKRVLEGAVNTYTRYAYDGWNVIAEFNGNAFAAATDADRTFAWGLDLVGSLSASGGVGALLQISDLAGSDSGEYLPAYDGNGNVAALYDAVTGTEEAVYEYSPFGEMLRATGDYADANPFRFSTKFADDETGLVYYGHRYYSASLGRFINRDPIEETGGLNLYGFVGNNPVNGYDYLGMLDGDDDAPSEPPVDPPEDEVVYMSPYEAWAGNDDPYLGHNEYKLSRSYNGLALSAETAEANRRLQEALNRLLELNQELKNVVEGFNANAQLTAALQGDFTAVANSARSSQLTNNFDQADHSQNWHYSKHSIDIYLPGGVTSREGLEMAISELSNFRSFDNPIPNIASVSVTERNGQRIANFDLRGPQGTVSDLIGNDDVVSVLLSSSTTSDGFLQMAQTTGNHQLVGVRFWAADIVDSSTLRISTYAYEQPRGFWNRMGFDYGSGSGDQYQVWTRYLVNIARNTFGDEAAGMRHVSYQSSLVDENPYIPKP